MRWRSMAKWSLLAASLLSCGGDDDKLGSDDLTDSDGGTVPGGVPGLPTTTHFFLPTADETRNTVHPSIEVDGTGNFHMIAPAYAIGDAFYGYCGSNCADAKNVKSVKLETDGTVANAMLAIGPDNKPRVLLSTFLRVYYGVCTGDCTQRSGWELNVIAEHGGDNAVTGEAFALTADGKPRFVMHTEVALFGIGQKPPKTYYMSCDANCGTPAGWTQGLISGNQIWQETSLRLDAAGRPHLGLVAEADKQIAGYAECLTGDCNTEAAWTSVGLYEAYSNTQVERIYPSTSLALTSDGKPRLLLMGKNADGKKNIIYYGCETGCTDGASWHGQILSDGDALGDGLDLALDAKNNPRFVYTFNSNIGLAHCDGDCAADTAKWDLTKVELGSDMPADDIFLYPNCTVGAWFLRNGSLAVGKDSLPRVVYQAEDISGGFQTTDPTKPPCTAGTDMTLSRFAQLSAY